MNELITLLQKECNFCPDSKLLAKLLDSMEEVHYRPKEPVIGYGILNSDIYIVKHGICRFTYFEGDKEVTLGFAAPGTVILSPHSYYMSQPAFMQIESCNDTTLLKSSKKNFDSMVFNSPELLRWMYEMAMCQLYTCEMKLSKINGSAKERYAAMLKNRPDIIQAVSDKILASYIGVTQQYLSNIKRELLLKR